MKRIVNVELQIEGEEPLVTDREQKQSSRRYAARVVEYRVI